MTKGSRVEMTVSFGACIFGCLMILLAPPELVISFFLAALLHELCHVLMLRRLHVPIYGIFIGMGGAAIQTGPLSDWQELLCAGAGPLGSFLCLMLRRRFPMIALCGFLQGSFNLLPVYPMDGGRILGCACRILFPERAAFLCRGVAFLTVAGVSGLCGWLYLRTAEHLFLFITLWILIQTCRSIKIPCKAHRY